MKLLVPILVISGLSGFVAVQLLTRQKPVPQVQPSPHYFPSQPIIEPIQEPEPPSIPDDPIVENQDVDRIFRGVSGSVAVIKDGKFLYKQGYGDNTPYTNYRMASVSKQFTAMAIMICKERGLLNYSDNLQKFWPDFPEYGRHITVKHLLTHTSGLPRDGAALVSGRVSDRKIVEALKRSNRSYRPGGFSYCNVGYCILAVIVEEVSKQDYPEFMQKNVFGPIGMKNSAIYEDGKEIQHRAYGSPQDQSRTSYTWGDGCVYTSVHEYWAWDQALHNGMLVSKETLREAFTPHVGSYGFGWFVSSGLVSHTGSTVGFRTATRRYDDGLTVVVFCNEEVGASSLCSQVARLFR